MKNRLDHAGAWMIAMVATVVARWDSADDPERVTRWDSADDPERDRGDVPGWVMITVMSAVLVVVILGVFQDEVKAALTGIFDKIK